MNARFQVVTCSQCGRLFGPGNAGYSHCDQHEAEAVAKKHAQMTDDALSMSLFDDDDAKLLADATLAAFVRGQPEVAARIGHRLMLRAAEMARAEVRRELAGE